MITELKENQVFVFGSNLSGRLLLVLYLCMSISNINDNKTYNKFGYHIDSLKPSSEKYVIWSCDTCNKEKEKKFRYAKLNSSCLACSNKKTAIQSATHRSTQMKEWYKNNTHPLNGTKRPIHVREAISKAHTGKTLSLEHKLKLSVAFTGEKNHFYGKKHSQESLEKMKIYQKEHARTGKLCNFYGKIYHGKGKYYTKNNNKTIWLRSSWEVKFAKYLDDNNIVWEYEHKAFEIVVNNTDCTYSPDFYLVEQNKYIEIKGYWRDDAIDKHLTFLKTYPSIDIEVYDKDKLKKLGVI